MLISTTVDTLTVIWERLLQRSPIGPEDSFFDLSGTHELADLLFAEIAEVCGRQLPSAAIMHAPTIAALAALLEEPTLPRFSPLIKIKTGTEKPAIFIVHGLGCTASFVELANHIETQHPIYGIQAKGLDGSEEPLARVEDMAAFYLDAIDELQPQGTYILMGYSFGGLVALEMVQRLSKTGKTIALLVLLDTYPHIRFLSPIQRLRIGVQKTRFHIGEMRKLSFQQAFAYLLRKFQGRFEDLNASNQSEYPQGMRSSSLAETSSYCKQKAHLALASYRPRFYNGKINFVTAATKSFFLPQDPASVWASLAKELKVDTVPGEHLQLVTTQCDGLASLLTQYIQKVAP